MGVVVVISLICTIIFTVANLAYEDYGESIVAFLFGIGAILFFILTLILGYFLIIV